MDLRGAVAGVGGPMCGGRSFVEEFIWGDDIELCVKD